MPETSTCLSRGVERASTRSFGHTCHIRRMHVIYASRIRMHTPTNVNTFVHLSRAYVTDATCTCTYATLTSRKRHKPAPAISGTPELRIRHTNVYTHTYATNVTRSYTYAAQTSQLRRIHIRRHTYTYAHILHIRHILPGRTGPVSCFRV